MTPDVQLAVTAELDTDEGRRLFVYDDATGKPIVAGTHVIGNPSIGIGRNLSGRGITVDESSALLANDLVAVERDLTAAIPWIITLSANRQAVLYSLYFNTSLGDVSRFLSRWPNLLRQVRSGQYKEAAANLLSSQPWASEVGAGRATRLSNFLRYG